MILAVIDKQKKLACCGNTTGESDLNPQTGAYFSKYIIRVK
ncbi:hypothetical protein yberc0001_23160 [Yersinia bercovieri ATCC 43970]|uniref:Uncharacterized protein n=1 Tax=Yersinia bercovieri ATCC 43970 TaxID=349968 RepID=A0ABM9Y297_YERBE|nr:hypothetical protein yberc0001_23160 [Yersinia bercovieri ATCC 43970]